jgi:serine/threonine-protein kinase
MSPEQLRGEAVDARSDVYSLGCLLYACLTGSAPFHRETAAATITAHLHEEPPSVSDVPGVPKAFDAVISRALAKQPKDRYRGAGELGASALATAHSRRQRGWSFARRSEPEVPPPIVSSVPVMAPAADPTRVADPTRPTVVRTDAKTKLDRTAVMPAPADETSRLPGAAHGRRPWQMRPRGVDLALLGGLLAVVLAIAAIILVTAHGPRRAAGPLTGKQINAAVHDFATDYSRHDVRSLSRLLATDVSRVDPSSSQHGRAAVLREYESQFTTRPVPTGYVLGDLKVTPGWAGRAEGEYTLTVAGGGHLSGHVVFGIQRTGNRAQLALISTQ